MARLQASSPKKREKRVLSPKALPDFAAAISPRASPRAGSLAAAAAANKDKPLPDFSVSPRSASPRSPSPKEAATSQTPVENKTPLPHFRGASSTPVSHKPPGETLAAPSFAPKPKPVPRKVTNVNTTLGMRQPSDKQIGKGREVPKPIPDFSFQRSPQKKESVKKEMRPLPDFAQPFRKGNGQGAPFASQGGPRKESPLQKARAEAQAREAALVNRMAPPPWHEGQTPSRQGHA